METVLYDAARAEAFAGRLTDAYNGAPLALMISVGHRTGLFDAFAGIGAVTSAELAAVAGLNERYVREWLGAMTTGAVVDYDPDADTYRLPREHAEWLTRAASPNNLAVMAQYFPVLGAVEDDIVRVFREGGGVPYERFGRFHDVMEEESGQSVVAGLSAHILPLVPGMEARLGRGARLVDLGCGRGRALIALARRFPRSRFLGLDLSPAAIAHAREQARGLDNVTFEVRDLSTFDADAEPGSFEFATTFDAVHDQAHPLALLRGIRRALTPDGVYLMQDIHGSSHVDRDVDNELGTFLYTISCLHCMTVSLAQGGEGLGAMWGAEKARELLAEAGFGTVELHQLEHDPVNAYYVARPWERYVPPEDARDVRAAIERVIGGGSTGEREGRWLTRSGAIVHVLWTCTSLPMIESGPVFLVSAADISERKRQEEEVRNSRTRIVAAADEARRRLERNLHDGAQQRLMALLLLLRVARAKAADPDVFDAAIAELTAALDELRELARRSRDDRARDDPARLRAPLWAAVSTSSSRTH